ncbi:MAG: hypothetical protein AAGD14_17830 [Planctomycetota bacterium]
MRRVLSLFLLGPLLGPFLAGCASPTLDQHMNEQSGYTVHSGFVRKTVMTNPQVKQLADGTAYTSTQEGDSVVLYNEVRDRRGKRDVSQTFQLKPGDQFIKASPLSYVLIKR